MGETGAVVVTGASTGIGEATATLLCEMGFEVFAGVRKPADGERLAAKGPGRIRPLILDVADGRSIARAAEEVEAAVGARGLAGLVNNAGISGGAPLEFTAVDEIRRMFEVNVFGLISTTQAFLPSLRRGRGRLVCMGSISGRMAVPFIAPYSASKAAVQALCHCLRVELVAVGNPRRPRRAGIGQHSDLGKGHRRLRAAACTRTAGTKRALRTGAGAVDEGYQEDGGGGHSSCPRSRSGGACSHRGAAQDPVPHRDRCKGAGRARTHARSVARQSGEAPAGTPAVTNLPHHLGLSSVDDATSWRRPRALRTLASINGRLLAQSAVSIDSSTVIKPAP
jgi:NADP-dependent 3-hydroxy acid dehydrogenase YdfG